MKAGRWIGYRTALALLLSFALFTVGTASSVWAATKAQVDELRDLLEKNHLNKPDDNDLNQSAINAMVDSLQDPYTQYFNDQEWQTFSNQLEQTFVGIGIVLTQEAGVIYISDVLPGSPAESAGVLPGDAIVSADGTPVKGMSISDLQKKLRGTEGTTVKLGLSRDGQKQTYPIKRESIQLPAASGQMMGEGIGYLALTGFTSDAGAVFRTQLDKLEKDGLHSLIIDLRNNGGGYVNAAQQIAGLFIKDGVLANLKDRDGNDHPLTVKGGEKTYPVTILVNGNSASASELFAGAMQDYGIAKLIGTQTFGKGVVQSIIPLESGGMLKVTVEEYFTPNGRKVNKKGITPDLVVDGAGEQLIQAFRDAGGEQLSLTAGRGSILVNGVRMAHAGASVLRGQDWYANLRLTAALIGAKVSFDRKKQSITLTRGEQSHTIPGGDNRLINKGGWNFINVRVMQGWYPELSADTKSGQLRLHSDNAVKR